MALVATNSSLASTLIINMVSLMHPDFEYKRWIQFLIYLGVTFTSFAVNAWMQRFLPQVNGTALVWSIAGFAIISITVLACAAPEYATGRYVFATWLNETGWPDGAYSLERCRQRSRSPRVCVSTSFQTMRRHWLLGRRCVGPALETVRAASRPHPRPLENGPQLKLTCPRNCMASRLAARRARINRLRCCTS